MHRLTRITPFLLAAMLTGCGGPTDAQVALEKARREMLALKSGGAPSTPAVRREVQSGVVSSLRTVADRFEGARAASANLLLAEAHAGLGQLDAAEAAALDARLFHMITAVRAQAGLYAGQMALAAALEAHDPGDQVSDLDEQAGALDEELERAKRAKADVEARLAALEKAAAEQSALAERERKAEIAARTEASQSGAAGRTEMYRSAYDASRRGAGYERKASDLEAQAAELRPAIAEHDLEIDRIQRQRALVDTAKQSVTQAVSAAREQARKARADADQAAGDLREKLGALAEFWGSEVSAKRDSAIASYKSAVQAARSAVRAAGQDKLAASMALAAHQQSLADVYGTRARTTALAINLVDFLKGVHPPLPESAGLDELKGRLSAARDEALAAAAENYEAARAAMTGAGARGETAERIRAVAAQLPGAPAPTPEMPMPEQPMPEEPMPEEPMPEEPPAQAQPQG